MRLGSRKKGFVPPQRVLAPACTDGHVQGQFTSENAGKASQQHLADENETASDPKPEAKRRRLLLTLKPSGGLVGKDIPSAAPSIKVSGLRPVRLHKTQTATTVEDAATAPSFSCVQHDGRNSTANPATGSPTPDFMQQAPLASGHVHSPLAVNHAERPASTKGTTADDTQHLCNTLLSISDTQQVAVECTGNPSNIVEASAKLVRSPAKAQSLSGVAAMDGQAHDSPEEVIWMDDQTSVLHPREPLEYSQASRGVLGSCKPVITLPEVPSAHKFLPLSVPANSIIDKVASKQLVSNFIAAESLTPTHTLMLLRGNLLPNILPPPFIGPSEPLQVSVKVLIATWASHNRLRPRSTKRPVIPQKDLKARAVGESSGTNRQPITPANFPGSTHPSCMAVSSDKIALASFESELLNQQLQFADILESPDRQMMEISAFASLTTDFVRFAFACHWDQKCNS